MDTYEEEAMKDKHLPEEFNKKDKKLVNVRLIM
jgi:hypothetical protein